MIYFVGAGPGAVDLITVRGRNLLEKADVIVYTGSLVNPGLLKAAKPGCRCA
jgi:precorrin-4/cobalt-precorrin-4 C11-methyltransferase